MHVDSHVLSDPPRRRGLSGGDEFYCDCGPRRSHRMLRLCGDVNLREVTCRRDAFRLQNRVCTEWVEAVLENGLFAAPRAQQELLRVPGHVRRQLGTLEDHREFRVDCLLSETREGDRPALFFGGQRQVGPSGPITGTLRS